MELGLKLVSVPESPPPEDSTTQHHISKRVNLFSSTSLATNLGIPTYLLRYLANARDVNFSIDRGGSAVV